MAASNNYILSDLKFELLPAFASYILNNKLDEFGQLQLEFSKELKLPMLQFFKWMSEDELLEMSKIENKHFLQLLSENNARGMIENAIERWLQNQLPGIGKNTIETEDVSLIIHIRKRAFLKLIPSYVCELNTALNLIDEIERFSVEQQSISVKTYIEILNKKINEHVHFIERITETTPGIIYVFDLLEQREVYTNNKVKELLGYTRDDLSKMQSGLLNHIMHPDDVIEATKYVKELRDVKDGEIRSLKYRVKNKDGQYKWMRNYESVFKRTPNGKPWQLIGIALDIDKEKRAAEDLHSREEQLLEAQQMAQSGSFTWNIKDDSSFTTPELTHILNLRENEPIKNFLLNVHRLDKDKVEKTLNNAIEDKNSYECEFRYIAGEDEKVIWLRGKVVSANDDDVKVKGTIMDVTNYHSLLQRIKQSEKLYKQAEALTHIGNWKWNIKENKVEWSDELYRIHGLQPQSEDITFERVVSFVHPDQKQLLVDRVSKCLTSKEPYEVYYKICLEDKTEKYIYGKGEVLADEQGEPDVLFGTAQDITEQYNTHLLLEENQKYLEKITDASPALMVAYNVQTHQYNFVSKAIENILGYSQKQILKEGTELFRKIIHPNDIRLVAEQNNGAIKMADQNETHDRKDIISDFVYRAKHKNGAYKWLQTYGTILDRDAEGKVEHMLHISLDITGKVEAEKKIKEQEHLIQHIADASPTILYVYDLQKKEVVYVNHEVYHVLNFTPVEITDLKNNFFTTIFHPDDFATISSQHRKLIEGKNYESAVEYEVRMKHKTEGWRFVLLKEIVFKKDELGEICQVLCAALDITPRKEMERALFEKTIELHQSNRSLEEFAYVASHDLKEPLRKITAFGDRLLSSQQDRLDTNGQFFLTKIIDSSKRMSTMIDDLLALSMISNAKEFETYSLQTILEEVLQTLEFKIEKRRAIIIADQLPQAQIIPSQFRQLFQNLISNALKFTDAGMQPEIKILCKILKDIEVNEPGVAKAQRYIQLKFIDNGIGFEQEYAEKIFVVFQRLHGRSEYDGTGIGLAICKKIVEHHGGVISATSVPNKGSTFTVVLPFN